MGLETVLDAATEIANEITDNYEEIVAILTRYETWTTAVDETERALRALRNLKREGDFIIRVRSGLHVAALLPINQPLYSLLGRRWSCGRRTSPGTSSRSCTNWSRQLMCDGGCRSSAKGDRGSWRSTSVAVT